MSLIESVHNLYLKSPAEKARLKTVQALQAKKDRNPNHTLGTADTSTLRKNQLILRSATRRQVLAWSASAAALAIFGAEAAGVGIPINLGKSGNSIDYSAFDGWDKDKGMSFQKGKIDKMGLIFEQETEMPGYPEVGELMRTIAQGFADLKDYTETEVTSFDVGLIDLPDALTQFAEARKYDQVDADVVKKDSGENFKGHIFMPKGGSDFQILFDNSITGAPRVAKELIIASEFSQFLYWKEFKDFIMKSVTEKYDFPTISREELREALSVSASYKDEKSSITSFGPEFDNADSELSGAGLWHTMRAFGKFKFDRALSPRDLQNLPQYERAFEAAVAKGILVETTRGNYDWKKGIGPFSPEWISIAIAVRKN